VNASVAVPTLLPDRLLRALVAIADQSLDVGASEERLLCVVVDRISDVLGDRSTAWLPGSGPDEVGTSASCHPAAVQAELEAAPVGRIEAPWLTEHGYAEALVVPVGAQGRVIGTLAVTRAADRPAFTETEVEIVTAIGDMAGVAVYGSRIRQATMISLEEVRSQAAVVEQVSEALVACDADNLIVNWNAGAERLYGYSSSEAIGCHAFALLATRFFPDEGPEMAVEEVLAQVATLGEWHGELRERAADGAPLVVMSSMTGTGGAGLISVNRDVTGQRQEEHRAMHDALTGLPNRRLLDTRLYEAIARACRSGKALAVAFVDLDGFKPVNDTYGHAAGDAVLVGVANRLLGAVRRTDTVGRLGGDEFLVILEEAGTMEHIRQTTARIGTAVAEAIEVDGVTVQVGASLGVAVVEQPGAATIDAEALLHTADTAMYAAKQARSGAVFSVLP